jgi:hypothetical protein
VTRVATARRTILYSTDGGHLTRKRDLLRLCARIGFTPTL